MRACRRWRSSSPPAPIRTSSEGFGDSPSILKITLKDGQTFEQRRDFATGSAKIPFTPAQLEEKFMDCATQTVSADSAKKLFAL